MLPRSFALRIFLLNFGLLILPLLFYFFLIFRWEFQGKVESVIFDLHNIGESRAALIEDTTLHEFRVINFLENTLQAADSLTSTMKIKEEFSKLKDTLGDKVISYYIQDGKDQFVRVASTDLAVDDKSAVSVGFLRDAISHGSSIHLGKVANSNLPVMYVSKAVFSNNKSLLGVFVMRSPFNTLLNEFVNPEAIKLGARFSILSDHNTVFISSDKQFERKTIRHISEEVFAQMSQEQQEGRVSLDKYPLNFVAIKGSQNAYRWEEEGVKHIGVLMPVNGTGLILLLDAKESNIYYTIYREIGSVLLFFSIIVILVAILNLWIIKRLANPINHLFDVMVEIGKGDYKIRYQNDALGYEINTIGIALNHMTDNLVHYMDAIKNERIKKESISKELTIGREIQISISPQELPKVDNLEIVGKSMPALEVGGDFYDVYVKQDEANPDRQLLFLSIGDAFGKGISSCLYSFGLRSMLRSYGMQYTDVAKMMLMTNNLFCKDVEKTSISVKVFSLLYDSLSSEFEYASAGHGPAILFRKDGVIDYLNLPGEALGIKRREEFSKARAKLFPGDILFLCVDAVINALGNTKLVQLVRESKEKGPEGIVAHLFNELEHMFENEIQKEDMTVILIKSKETNA